MSTRKDPNKPTAGRTAAEANPNMLDAIGDDEPEKVMRSAADQLLVSIRADDTNDGPPVAVTKPILTVPIRQPRRGEFYRVHADPTYTLPVLLVSHGDSSGHAEMYIVTKRMRDIMAEFASPYILMTCINRDGNLFLWPLRRPREDGRDMGSWTSSAIAIAELARTKWLRRVSNTPEQRYEPYVAPGLKDEPKWPDLSFESIVEKAVSDGRIIDNENHHVVRQKLGYE